MRTKKSIILGSILASLLIALFLIGNLEKKSPSVDRVHASFSLDINQPNVLVGDADFVFVGHVISYDGTNNNPDFALPYSKYSVKVVKNLKNNLPLDDIVSIQKSGGLNDSGDKLIIYDQDFLPEQSKEYIFLAYVQENGSLLISGPNSTIKYNESTLTQYLEATRNQVYSDRPRFQVKL